MTGLCRIIARLIAIAFAGLSLTTATQAQSTPPDKPNIFYILADDLGWKDVGFHGSDIKTPNIDELAQTGAELEQFYVQAMCTQTRAVLMTGRYPLRYGLQTLVIPASMTYGLPKDEYLLPQALKSAGYETAIVGKWHLGHASKDMWRCSEVSIISMAVRSGRSIISRTKWLAKPTGTGIAALSMKRDMSPRSSARMR